MNDRDRDPKHPADQPTNLNATILVARNGDQEVLGGLLEAFRGRLRAAAEQDIQKKLRTRIDPSDIVQQTFLSAINNFSAFDGHCEAELAAWLEQIQKRNILDAVRLHVRSDKRSLDREQSTGKLADRISELADQHVANPSHAAMASDERRRIEIALEQLAPDQREAVRLRHLEGKTLAQIMEMMGRSREAAAALIKRGVANLRKQIHDTE